MALTQGSRIGPYEIQSPLGEGGMGVVFRARDTKLQRDVAIKLLPDHFGGDAERLARLHREAQVLASLNHPNIAQIYGLEDSSGTPCIVMELVEGVSLDQHIARRRMPLDEVMTVAKSIADALEVAHDRGIIHRDLKPANIKIMPDGRAKVLDFGLAKPVEAEAAPSLTNSPTLIHASVPGVVLGTAAYMSPEQARGKPVDKRTDVWAFGCVLYEMLTGHQAFGGETVSDSISATLGKEPDWSRLPPATPRNIRNVIRRCLEKDSRNRLRDIGDARIELEEPIAIESTAPVDDPLRTRPWAWVMIAATLALMMGGIASAIWFRTNPSPAPDWTGTLLLGGSTVALYPRVSPDGNTVAFQVLINGLTQIGLMNAESGSWSVLTQDRSKGPVINHSWAADGTRLFYSRSESAIFSIPAVGGAERLVLENAAGPETLPDGSLLFVPGGSSPDASAAGPGSRPPLQLQRFWPETGRAEKLPAWIHSNFLTAYKGFPDGKEVVFFGTVQASDTQPHLYILDLSSLTPRRLIPEIPLRTRPAGFPIAIGRDGQSVLIDIPSGDLHRIVEVSRSSGRPNRTLLTLTSEIWFMDVGPDGTIFTDQLQRPLEFIRFTAGGGNVEQLASSPTEGNPEDAIQFPSGHVLLATTISGKQRLVVSGPNKEQAPFIETKEETAAPAALIAGRDLAFMLGSPPNQVIAIASITGGRISRRITPPATGRVARLAASTDGAFLYCIIDRNIWVVPVDGQNPRRIGAADSLAVHPNGREVIVQRTEKGETHRYRLNASGEGAEQQIRAGESSTMIMGDLGTSAVNSNDRLLVTVAPLDSWFWGIGIVDLNTGMLTRVPTDYAGDISGANWTSDGKIIATGLPLRSSIWRFRPAQPARS